MAYEYTVSRAFHLMRNSAAIMQSIYVSYRIMGGILMEYDEQEEKWTESKIIFTPELMGSWIEIKDPAIEKPRQGLEIPTSVSSS